jgi:uracil-DNA glycosylase
MRPRELMELLRFYADAGVDEALQEEAVDRFAEAAAPARAAVEAQLRSVSQMGKAEAQGASRQRPTAQPPAASPAPQVQARMPDEAQAQAARELARKAESLDELRQILEGFEGCNLRFTAKQLVFADGNPQADIMLVGEAPGRDEDLEGRPFVGRSGRLLDRMLAAIGLDRQQVYIANVIPWRPPGNRTPTPLETEICRPFIERQVELVAPKLLVTLGAPSSKVLIGGNDGILKSRGKWQVHRTQGGMEVPAMPTLHPAYLLRNPAHKKLAWRDLLEIRARLSQSGG